MSAIKHIEGDVTLSGDELMVVFDRWTANPGKKSRSPLILRIAEIVRIEQQVSTLNERFVRIVTEGYTAARKPAEDPYVLHFQPVRSGYANEAETFIVTLASSVDAHRRLVTSGSPPHFRRCLVQVDDINTTESTGARMTAALDVSGPAPSRPAAPSPSPGPFPLNERVPFRYNSPPNWPAPPENWSPPPSWKPDPAWGAAPEGWSFWEPVERKPGRHSAIPDTVVPEHGHYDPGPSEAPSVRQEYGAAPRETAPNPPPHGPALRSGAVSPSAFPVSGDGVPVPGAHGLGPGMIKHVDTEVGLFGARGRARELAGEVNRLLAENSRLHADLDRLGALGMIELERRKQLLEEEIALARAAHEAERQRNDADRRAEHAHAVQEFDKIGAQLTALKRHVAVTEDLLILQEAGVYDYAHPLDDSVAYKSELAQLKDQIKTMTRKNGGAVDATTSFTMNGSLTEGRKMVNEFSKLLLRAYNNEADNLVRGMKPYRLDTSKDRLNKSRSVIEKLGRSMDIRISSGYHHLRMRELELTADHINKVAEEKERDREEKARLREEKQAQADLEREKTRLDKERRHYENALLALRAKGDEEGAARLEHQLSDISKAIEDVDYRAANVRAGYVYVISNLGSFGEQVVKVGMTRRLEPMDRVRELSDASVPFNFDVHAIHFSDDAVGVEAEMHRRLAAKRVNRVNHRREFFYTTPAEVRELLASVAGDLLEYNEDPEALEYRQSISAAESAG